MKYPRLQLIVRDLISHGAVHASVRLAVGELVLDEVQLQAEWNQLTSKTPLAKTKLNIRIIPAEQQCMWCFLVYHPNEKETACPQCRSMGAKILKGEEFYLEEE